MFRVMRVELQIKLFIWEKTTEKFYINISYIFATNQSKKTGPEAVQSNF